MINNLDNMKRKLALSLRAKLSEKGWSQSELARRAGMGRDSISTYLKQKTFPEPVQFMKMCKALDCDPDELCAGFVNATDVLVEIPFEMKHLESGDLYIRFSGVVDSETALAISALQTKYKANKKKTKKRM